jgi:GTP cyclohydrolase I
MVMTATGTSAAPVDLDAATRAVRELLLALGRDPDDERLAGTPERVAHACADLLAPRAADAVVVANDDDYDDLVLARDIPFVSMCSRHLLPLRGVAHVGYLPDRYVAERSALTCIVERFAADLQTQERMTQQIADDLVERVAPKGAAVVVEAEHRCTPAHQTSSRTVTTAVRGVLRDDVRARFEFFTLTRRGRNELAATTNFEVS